MASRSIQLVALLASLSLLAGGDRAEARSQQSTEQRFVEGLLTRQLYSLAEAHCREQLARTDLSKRQRAELAVELSRTHTLRALSLPSAQSEVVWQAAFDALAEAQETDLGSSFPVLLRRQQALVHRARGDLLRQSAEVVTTAAPLRQQARTEFRKAIVQLSELEADLTTTIANYPRANLVDSDILTESELRNLREDVRSQLSRALVSQGLTYPSGSSDRTNSIVRAKKRYAELAERDDPIDWESRVAMVRCDRLLENEAVARQRLAALLEDVPARVAVAVRLEQARLEYDTGHPDRALEILQERTTQRAILPEWDYEYLRTLLALRSADLSKQALRRLESRTNNLVRTIEQQHGAYWMRRAEALLGRHIAASPQSQDAEMLSRAAANFFRSDKPDEALATYDKAAQIARESGSDQQAFDLAFTAASIEQRRGRYDAAARRYREAALALPEYARAAQAHLLSAYNVAQLARAGQAGALDRYVKLLEEHLQTWPAADTAAQARIWLAGIFRSRGAWSAAIEQYRGIPVDSPSYELALDSLISCYRDYLNTLRSDERQRREVASQAASYYSDLLLDERGRMPERLTPLQQKLLLAWAATRMVYQREGYDELEQLLQIALESAAESASPAWQAKARTLIVLALAGQPRQLDKAQAAAGQLEGAGGEDLIALVLALDVLRANSDGARERALADLQLSIAEQFKKLLETPDKKVRRRLSLAGAAALVEAERFVRARQRYAELAEEYPDDGEVQLRYAQLLSRPEVAIDILSRQAALAQWRVIERRSAKASPMWFDAKYHQAEAHHRLGNSEQALRVIKLTSALHPELGGEERKARFEKLRTKCEQAL